ncbi:MAG: hypothetical protein Q4A72_04650 [Bacillota bacterium]|nr:hypothetical protein [Bacillota bacterium]
MIEKFVGFDDSEDGINEDFEPEGVNVRELLSPDFISKYTEYKSLDEIFAKFGIDVDLDKIEEFPVEKLDEVFSKVSEFSSWSEMLSQAIQDFYL